MCTSRAEGGRRCAAYWRERSTRYAVGSPEWDEAAAQAATSPRVRDSYLYLARTAEQDGNHDHAAAYRTAARRGHELETRNRESALEEQRIREQVEEARAAQAFAALTSRLPDGWTYEPVSPTHGHVRGPDAAGYTFTATAQVQGNNLSVKWFGFSGVVHERTDHAPWHLARLTSSGGANTLHIPLDGPDQRHHLNQAQIYLSALAADRFTYFGDDTLTTHGHVLTHATAAWAHRYSLTPVEQAHLRHQVHAALTQIARARNYEEGDAVQAFASTLHRRPLPETETGWEDRISDSLGLAPLALDQAAASEHYRAARERAEASNAHHRTSTQQTAHQANLDRQAATYLTAAASRTPTSSDPWASR